MNRLFFSYKIALLACLLLLASCKKEQALLQNTDCSCAKEVSADFKMEELGKQFMGEDLITETDTCYDNKIISYTAFETNATYKWKIGSVIRTEQVFKDYTNVPPHTLSPVTLVVTKKPNSICFPDDDGYDSITKYLYVKGVPDDLEPSVIEGVYRMKDQNKADSVDITLDYRGSSADGTSGDLMLDLYNYDGNGSNSIQENSVFPYSNYREFEIGFGDLYGVFKLGLDGKATFDFVHIIDLDNGLSQTYHYTGRKL